MKISNTKTTQFNFSSPRQERSYVWLFRFTLTSVTKQFLTFLHNMHHYQFPSFQNIRDSSKLQCERTKFTLYFFHSDTDFYALSSEHEAAFREKHQNPNNYSLQPQVSCFEFRGGTLGIFFAIDFVNYLWSTLGVYTSCKRKRLFLMMQSNHKKS